MNDGGPAFPKRSNFVDEAEQIGMSLRDYFAAQALAAVIGITYKQQDFNWANSAKGAYALADAMLAAREHSAIRIPHSETSPADPHSSDTSTHD